MLNGGSQSKPRGTPVPFTHSSTLRRNQPVARFGPNLARRSGRPLCPDGGAFAVGTRTAALLLAPRASAKRRIPNFVLHNLQASRSNELRGSQHIGPVSRHSSSDGTDRSRLTFSANRRRDGSSSEPEPSSSIVQTGRTANEVGGKQSTTSSSLL